MAAALVAAAAKAENLSFYGTSGLIDMPSASRMDDGTMGLTVSQFGPTLRNTLTFQIAPRVQGSFRYTKIDGFDNDGRRDRFDRSFDLTYHLLDETALRPAVSVGIRDFGGTGTFSGEFVVATKQIGPVAVTGGLGWGRLGSRNGFDNPLGVLDDRFLTRPASGDGDINSTGRLDYNTWFRGDAALFGGLEWAISDAVTVTAEYSSDVYLREERRGVLTQKSPLNYGINYRFANNINLGAYYLYGTDAGLRATFVLDPDRPAVVGGVDAAPAALIPRDQVAAASWNRPGAAQAPADVLRIRLADEGLTLQGFRSEAGAAKVQIQNTRFQANAQALGRAARIMANTLPADIAAFDVTLVSNGLALTTTRLVRRDLEELEHALDGTWQSFARARIVDAHDVAVATDQGDPYPRLSYDLGYYVVPALFDPDAPVRVEYGARFDAAYTVQPGLILSGQIRQELGGNLSDAERVSNSVVEPVRSNSFRYARESQTELTHLTGEYFFRPRADMFGRISAGYLEPMFGGVSAEVLWYPVASNLALGAELNYARQRDFDGGFGFQDYDVITGHASAYYDAGNGYIGQIDVGRYLAGDWGATFAVDRAFDNGFRVGAFFTLTDMPFDDFGEGSFDKGIRIEIPTSWMIGRATRGVAGLTVRPILRDGGARLDVRNRLYRLTTDTRTDALADQWGRFWR